MATRLRNISVVLAVAVLVLLSGCGLINSTPVAQFTRSPSSGEVPLTVTFDASGAYDSDGFVAAYSWSFGDSAIGSGMVATHTYTSPGTYTARLTIRDNKGGTDTTSRSITVAPTPTPQYRVTVAEITSEFEANEYAATTKYEGSYIAVSGYVYSIGIDLRDEPYVSLVAHPDDSSFDPGVNCYFRETGPHPGLAELRAGDHVTIIAEFSFYSDLFDTVYLEKSRIE